MCEYNVCVCVCICSLYIIYVHISTSDNIYSIFANDKGKLVIFGKPNAVFLPIYETRRVPLSPSYSHLLGQDIVRMPPVICEGEDGGAMLTGCAGLPA